MPLVNFTNLDFDQIKTSIKEYLRANSNFTDYDFEGSNLSTLIDTLAYNTYISSYNANMISNEVFIDSATLRENVVSLARNIGYLPRSRTSSIAEVSFAVDTTNPNNPNTNPATLTLKKGIVCTSSSAFGAESYAFSIVDDITVPVRDNIATFSNIKIYDGLLLTKEFVVDANNPNQKFILDNANIDTSSIRVSVTETNGGATTKYAFSNSIIDINSSSRVFFLQEIEDQRYEIIFGNGVIGRKPENLSTINVDYLICSGISANGVKLFNYSGRIFDNNENLVTSDISLITTISPSQRGQDIESVESIKKYAPRLYSSQYRAVTANDYEAIIPQIYPEAESVSAYGGETLDPPQFGKVFIAIKPFNGQFLANSIKDNLKRELRKYSVTGIVPEIKDIKYLYVEYDSTVYYNKNLFDSASGLKTIINNNIFNYSKSSEINGYGSKFKYSRFQRIIDDSNASVTSNITKIRIRRDLKAELNKITQYEVCFSNSFHVGNNDGFNLKTSGFKVEGITDTVYLSDLPLESQRYAKGDIFLFRLVSKDQAEILRSSVGTIDYEKGEILLNPINITSTSKLSDQQPLIEFGISPKSNDVVGLQDLYLILDINGSNISMISDDISSGSDISGSYFVSTSSYSNGSPVRS